MEKMEDIKENQMELLEIKKCPSSKETLTRQNQSRLTLQIKKKENLNTE